jgi:hypothetical protein
VEPAAVRGDDGLPRNPNHDEVRFTLRSEASPDEKTPRVQSVFGVDRQIRGPSASVAEFHARGVARGDDHRSRSSIGRAE